MPTPSGTNKKLKHKKQGGAYGQVDAGVHYTINETLNVSLEASNLANALYKHYMQQAVGMMEHGAFYTGRRFTLRMGYSF